MIAAQNSEGVKRQAGRAESDDLAGFQEMNTSWRRPVALSGNLEKKPIPPEMFDNS